MTTRLLAGYENPPTLDNITDFESAWFVPEQARPHYEALATDPDEVARLLKGSDLRENHLATVNTLRGWLDLPTRRPSRDGHGGHVFGAATTEVRYTMDEVAQAAAERGINARTYHAHYTLRVEARRRYHQAQRQAQQPQPDYSCAVCRNPHATVEPTDTARLAGVAFGVIVDDPTNTTIQRVKHARLCDPCRHTAYYGLSQHFANEKIGKQTRQQAVHTWLTNNTTNNTASK